VAQLRVAPEQLGFTEQLDEQIDDDAAARALAQPHIDVDPLDTDRIGDDRST